MFNSLDSQHKYILVFSTNLYTKWIKKEKYWKDSSSIMYCSVSYNPKMNSGLESICVYIKEAFLKKVKDYVFAWKIPVF